MTQPETRVLDTAASPEALGDIELALERTWSDFPHVPELVRMHIAIAAGEIGANIVEHTAPGRQVRIWMDIRVFPTQVTVEFTDDGDPVQIDMDSVRMPDDMSERGRGLALAQAVLSRLTYRRSDVNHWVLISKPFS